MEPLWDVMQKIEAPAIAIAVIVIYFQFKVILRLIDLNSLMGDRLTTNTALVQSMSDCLKGIQNWMNSERRVATVQTFPESRP